MKKTLLALAISFFILVPVCTLAAEVTPTTANPTDISAPFQIKNPIGGSGNADLLAFLQRILDAIVLIITPFLVIMLVYAGFLFVTAQGNVEKLGEAKKVLLYTVIGAAVVLGAKGAADVIANTVSAIAS